MLGGTAKELLEKQHYRVVGSHSAVKICHWTKQSLTTGRVCYKQLWYKGVESHRCLQMTSFVGCNYSCVFCWRTHSGERTGITWDELLLSATDVDDPGFILQTAISERAELLSGYWGNPHVDKSKLREALDPKMMTLSLTGESTLYPRVSELLELARRREMTSFLVTNGSTPDVLRSLDPLPSQLYVSTPGADRQTYVQLACPKVPAAWDLFNKTIEVLPSLETTRVLRLTMIRERNMSNIDSYADLVRRGEPDFVEVKAYEWVGESQRRLPKSCMPRMAEIADFAARLSDACGYRIAGEFEPSGVVLLSAK